MSTEPHTLDGPALIKAGRGMAQVVEFYGVFLQGRLLIGNDGPRQFTSYAEADRFYAYMLAPGEMSETVVRR